MVRCERCKQDDSMWECSPPVLGYGNMCDWCHDAVRTVLLGISSNASRMTEQEAVALLGYAVHLRKQSLTQSGASLHGDKTGENK